MKKCSRCQKEFPDEELEIRKFNGTVEMPCKDCIAILKEQIAKYPKPQQTKSKRNPK